MVPEREQRVESPVYFFGRLFFIFFKIGALTVGGGYVMLPLIERELVDKKGWFERESFVDILALSQTVPGALAVNTAFQSGYRLSGITGGITAVLGAVLPSFLIILALAGLVIEYREHPVAINFFKGALPAIVALVAAAAWRMGRRVIKEFRGATLFLVLLLCGYIFQLNPFVIIAGGAVGGLLLFRTTKSSENSNGEDV